MNANKKKILLIEDDKVDQMAFKRFAGQADFPYEYRICGSISEAQEALKAEKFDLILSDYFLQDGTAFDILSDISVIPMIVVTGTGNEEIAVKAMKMGAFDYLIKDVEGCYLKVLPVTVENALKRFESEQKVQEYYKNLEVEVEKRTRKYKKEILQRKQTEKLLKASEEKFRIITEESADAIFITDKEGWYRYVNKAACGLLGYTVEELLSMNIADLSSKKKQADSLRDFGQLLEIGRLFSELELRRKDGTVVPTDLNAVILPNGMVYGSCRDISERRRTERKIEKDLQEKEVMLKEIHHRVKNNMQIIASIARLQSRGTKNKDFLKSSIILQSRIKAMALIHEKLYNSPDLSKIEFSSYIEQLAVHLSSAYSALSTRVSLRFKLDPIFLDVNKAIPCGLIINELMSNSLLHAFPEDRKGWIGVSLSQEAEATCALVVEDNGIGMPDQLNPKKPSTLGLQIVNDLARQIDAVIVWERKRGTKVTITI